MNQIKIWMRAARPVLAHVSLAVAIAFIALTACGFIDADAFAGGTLLGVAALAPLTDEQKKAAKEDQTGEKFRGIVIDSIESLKSGMTAEVDRLDKKTIKALEDLRNSLRSDSEPLEAKVVALQKAQLAMRNEERAAFGGDAIERYLSNPEKRAQADAYFRKQLSAKYPGVFTEAHQKALGEDSSPGSTLIKDEIASSIFDSLPEYGIYGTLGQQPMSTKNMNMPVDTADPVAYVVPEGADFPEDAAMAGSSQLLQAKQIGGLLTVQNTLIDDSEFPVGDIVMRKTRRALAKRLDHLAFMADGTNDNLNGSFTGVFNFAQTSTAASATTVEALDLADLLAIRTKTDLKVLQDNAARWWMNNYIQTRMLGVRDDNGRPIFLTALEAPVPGSLLNLLGSPVTLGAILPSTNSTGQKYIAFGAPNAFAVGIRKDIEIRFSDHAKFSQNARAFLYIARGAVKGLSTTSLTIGKLA